MPRPLTRSTIFAWLLTAASSGLASAAEEVPLAPGVRGLVTRAAGGVVVDGELDEWGTAFCTPVHYSHATLGERAAQVYYQWDETALFIGLRCLDTRRANPGTTALDDGDALVVSLRTGPGAGPGVTPGPIQLVVSAFTGGEVRPRWAPRTATAAGQPRFAGVGLAATPQPWGYECEFAIPWANFPDFRPRIGATLALNAELCSGDGATAPIARSPTDLRPRLSRPHPLTSVQLVKSFDPTYLAAAGPASFPLWAEIPWNQANRSESRAVVAVPPAFVDIVGSVDVLLQDAGGKVLKTVPARMESFGPEGLGFSRAVAVWSNDGLPPNTYTVSARVAARTGKTLVTVTPRGARQANATGR